MKNTKLYSILEHFNKYEQNRCRKYILSPYFNKNEQLVILFDLLIKHINSKSEKELEKEAIWKKLHKEKKYDDVRLRKYFSDLLKLVENFLAQQIYEANPLHQATYLIEAVGEKKMEKLYNSTMKTARRLSQQQLYKTASFYYYQYEIERNYLNLSIQERSKKGTFEAVIENLDYFYLAEKLKLYCSTMSRKLFVEYKYDLLFIEEIINHIKKYKFNHIPPIAIYYQIYLLQTEPQNNTYYFHLKQLLNKYALWFPLKEAMEVYTYARNYCIRKINSGNQKFLSELFELDKELIERKIIFLDGEISPWAFKNIIVVALRLGKYKWTEDFIKNYGNKIPEAYRENAITFNLARLYSYQKKHHKVISLLQKVEYEDITYNLDSKVILLITYFETDEIDALDALLESFRAFLNRHKDIPLSRRKYYKNLIRFTKKLSRVIPGDEAAVKKIKQEIEETKGFKDRWLNEQIAKLE